MEKRVTLKIFKIIEETKDIKTFTFKHFLGAKPGQFIMLTDFEGGEKPFSISDCTKDEFSITVKSSYITQASHIKLQAGIAGFIPHIIGGSIDPVE